MFRLAFWRLTHNQTPRRDKSSDTPTRLPLSSKSFTPNPNTPFHLPHQTDSNAFAGGTQHGEPRKDWIHEQHRGVEGHQGSLR
jgi:hypothetical protein